MVKVVLITSFIEQLVNLTEDVACHHIRTQVTVLQQPPRTVHCVGYAARLV